MDQGASPCLKELLFVKELERLKNTTRTAWTSTGRQKSTAEHSFRLALFVYVLQGYFPKIDWLKAITMALIHDLGEAYDGDLAAVLAQSPGLKFKREKRGLARLIAFLPASSGEQIMDLFLEYNEGLTPEARLVKALDKLETIIQHNQGLNPEDFDYAFNLQYGKKYTESDPLIRGMRSLLDLETKKKAGL